MVQRLSHGVVAGSLIGAGAVILSSLVTHVMSAGAGFWLTLLAVPGRFLYSSFHVAAFLVPLFLVVYGVSAAREDARTNTLSGINLLVLPFLSFALSLRLAFNAQIHAAPITRWAENTFTRPGGALFFLALGALLTVVALRVATHGAGAVFGVGALFSSHRTRGSESDSMRRSQSRITRLIADHSSVARDGADSAEGGESSGLGQGTGAETFEGPPPPVTASGRRSPDWLSAFSEEPEVSFGYNELYEEPTEVLDAEELEELSTLDRDWSVETISDEAWRADPAERHQPEELDDQVGEEADEAELEVVYTEGRFHDPGDRYDPAAGLARGDTVSLALVNYDENSSASDAAAEGDPRSGYGVPIEGLLDQYHETRYWEIDEETKEAAEVLRYTLEEFSIQAEVTGIRKGPVITMFEILPAPGVKLARITNLADNIALRLAASSVRIVAPIPGKHAVGIEIPNRRRHIVSYMELLQQDEFWSPKLEIPLALGKDIPGDVEIVDLTKTPHLLIAGATGSGKSVCVNSIICSILYRRSPEEVKMLLIDPKIVELKFYNDIPHLLTPVITDPRRAFQALQYCIYEMERRYSLLDSLGVRDIGSYNEKIKKRNLATEPLPYIVVVVDELADLMTTSGKELESTLARLAAMSRAVGIHLVLATQRPSTDVITGLIKANIPSRIAFMVSSKVDSRIIIDTGGAEKLLGQGDMLFTSAWDPFPTRMQGAFLSDAEVDRVVEHVKTLGEPEYIDDEIFVDDEDEDGFQGNLEDPLMEQAIDIVVSANKASASYLQRRLKIGYNRAARLVEEMERIGVVGPQRGSKPRDVLGAPESR